MSNWMDAIITLFFGILAGFLGIYLGIKGRQDKIERDMDLSVPADYLPGAYEGAVEKAWWLFVLFGIMAFIVGLVEFFNKL
mgnify:CR=1 FL=1